MILKKIINKKIFQISKICRKRVFSPRKLRTQGRFPFIDLQTFKFPKYTRYKASRLGVRRRYTTHTGRGYWIGDLMVNLYPTIHDQTPFNL